MGWTWCLLPGNLFSSSVALIFGLLFGSFLNVVIYRLPIMMVRQCENHLAQANGGAIPHRDTFNLALPDSFCESCHRPLAYWENIPVISYLLLLGRCRTCHVRISPRIPIIEALAGLATASIVWFFGVSLLSAAVLCDLRIWGDSLHDLFRSGPLVLSGVPDAAGRKGKKVDLAAAVRGDLCPGLPDSE